MTEPLKIWLCLASAGLILLGIVCLIVSVAFPGLLLLAAGIILLSLIPERAFQKFKVAIEGVEAKLRGTTAKVEGGSNGQIERLCQHLRTIGLDASVESKEHKKLRSGSIIMGSIRLANRNVDLVELEWLREEWQGEYGGGYIDSYRCNYIVEANVQNPLEGEIIKAEGVPIKRGFLNRKTIDFTWKGRDLAQILNRDVELREKLVSPRHMEVMPYPKVIRIRRVWSQRFNQPEYAFPTGKAFENYDKIAQHVVNLEKALSNRRQEKNG